MLVTGLLLAACILTGGIVSADIIARFAAVPASGSAPLNVSFVDMSQGNVTGWNYTISNSSWQISANYTYLESNTSPVFLFTYPGQYNVTLFAYNATDITDNNTAVVTNCVNVTSPVVAANFTAVYRNGTAPMTVSFIDQSTATIPVTYRWDFGDNSTTSTMRNPEHVYQASGNYSVNLTISDNSTYFVSNSTNLTNYISVINPGISANFTAVYRNGTSPMVVSFIDQSVSETNLTYLWNFGDNYTSQERNPEHRYLNRTTPYSVNLTVTDTFGRNSSLNRTGYIQVNQSLYPQAFFSFTPSSGAYPLNVTFIDESILDPANATNALYEWNFGDGVILSGGPQVVHTYTTPSTGNGWQPSLRVQQNGINNTYTPDNTVTVFSPSFVANFTAVPPSGITPLNVTFVDKSESSFPIVSYYWDFGDGTNSTNVSSPQHQYINPRSYNVTLTVTDSQGRSVSANKTNAVQAQAFVYPISRFTVTPLNGTAPLNVSVIDQSVLDPSIPTNAYTYRWVITDGGADPGDVQNFDHQFTTVGNYSIQLEITTPDGRVVPSEAVDVDVLPSHYPIVKFAATPTNGTAPLPVYFIDQSELDPAISENLYQYIWDFGDNSTYDTSNSRNVKHVYTSKGNFNATLTVLDPNQTPFVSQDLVAVNVTEPTIPVASFVAVPKTGRAPLDVTFIDQSAGVSPLTHYWTFGDGTNSTALSPRHRFDSSGTYYVNLTVTDGIGQNSTATEMIVATGSGNLPNFKADFNAVPLNGSRPLTVLFSDNSTGGYPDSWFWQFGDGAIGVGQNATHTYVRADEYDVSLTVRMESTKTSITKNKVIEVNR